MRSAPGVTSPEWKLRQHHRPAEPVFQFLWVLGEFILGTFSLNSKPEGAPGLEHVWCFLFQSFHRSFKECCQILSDLARIRLWGLEFRV